MSSVLKCKNCGSKSFSNTTLYVFVKFKHGYSGLDHTRLFSLDNRGEWIEEGDSCLAVPKFDMNSRIIAASDSVYVYRPSQKNGFKLYSSMKDVIEDNAHDVVCSFPPVRSKFFNIHFDGYDKLFAYNRNIFETKTYRNDALNSPEESSRGVYRYEPAGGNRWFALPELEKKVFGACSTADSGVFYVIGGTTNNGKANACIQMYDYRMKKWLELPSNMRIFKDNSAVCCVLKDKIYVTDGENVEEYDTKTRKSKSIGKDLMTYPSSESKKRKVSNCFQKINVLAHDNKVWIFGYETAERKMRNLIYNPVDGLFTLRDQLQSAITDAASEDGADSDDDYSDDKYRCLYPEMFEPSEIVGLIDAVVFTSN